VKIIYAGPGNNLILVGGTGKGKMHLATALGAAAIHQGKRVRYYHAVDRVKQLEQEKQQDKNRQSRQAINRDRCHYSG
jgi:DNA replication protein DnaC